MTGYRQGWRVSDRSARQAQGEEGVMEERVSDGRDETGGRGGCDHMMFLCSGSIVSEAVCRKEGQG